MGMIKCPVCGKEISDKVERCLYCDSDISVASFTDQQNQNRQTEAYSGDHGTYGYQKNESFDKIKMNNSNGQHYKSGEKTGSNKKMSSGAKVGIIVLVIVLICMFGMGACSLMLVAIGSMGGNKSENNVEKVEKMVAEASGEEIPDELAGFYMGDDGSGMCIFENGDCTFYYTYLGNTKKYVNLKSGYLDNRITVGIPEYGYCVYADYDAISFNGVLDFKSQNSRWNEEKFYKTGRAKDLSETEFLTEYNSFDPKAYKYIKLDKAEAIESGKSNEEDEEQMIYEAKRISDQADLNEEESEDTSKEADTQEKNPDGVDPELKAFLDSYEAFMDEYVEFMQKYKTGGNSLTLMTEYLEIMEKYQDFAEKAEKYDTDDMSDADSKYYYEVMTRINAKLLQVAY